MCAVHQPGSLASRISVRQKKPTFRAIAEDQDLHSLFVHPFDSCRSFNVSCLAVVQDAKLV